MNCAIGMSDNLSVNLATNTILRATIEGKTKEIHGGSFHPRWASTADDCNGSQPRSIGLAQSNCEGTAFQSRESQTFL
jgi:hypothetical protein